MTGRSSDMPKPQLSVRSARARELAHRLARRERRSIADIVERALEAYEIREAGREPASVFYARLSDDWGTDLDLQDVLRESRAINRGPELCSSSIPMSFRKAFAKHPTRPSSPGWCATTQNWLCR